MANSEIHREAVEVLTPIPGYEGHYALNKEYKVVSLKGRVPRPLKPVYQKGRPRIKLFMNCKGKSWFVHQLVMLVKEGPCPEGQEVCHNDRNPTNNHPSNLRYDTRSGNLRDEIEAGTHCQTRKTHCPQGHEYTEENTYVYENAVTGGISRQCRACAIERSRKRRLNLC